MQGKRLQFSEYTYPSVGAAKRCSLLAFSSLFETGYFLSKLTEEETAGGITTNMENSLLREFFSKGVPNAFKDRANCFGLHVEQYAIFETNGKFRIPTHYLEEIFDDSPSRGRMYIYFISIATSGGFHKQIYLRTSEAIYIIDSQREFVEVLSLQEFYSTQILNKITNLSALMVVPEKKFLFGTDGYDENLFKHLI